MGDKVNPYDSMSKHWKVKVAETAAKKKAAMIPEEISLTKEFDEISSEDRQAISAWAQRTSRTEELTGQQVTRILGLSDIALGDAEDTSGIPSPLVVLRQAGDEFRHAILYAQFAQAAWPINMGEIASRENFNRKPFTSIFRQMDALPVIYGGESFVHYMVGLFFLDLAGLMTVNVYEMSPFKALQQIAMTIHADEGRHVQMGRDYLLRVREGRLLDHTGRRELDGERTVRDGVLMMLPRIDEFFGNDDSTLQKTLRRVGIKTTKNSELKATFRKKVNALLHLD